jgi:hypothetical protein
MGKHPAEKRTRHINIRYFFITNQIAKKEGEVQYCPTKQMVADYYALRADVWATSLKFKFLWRVSCSLPKHQKSDDSSNWTRTGGSIRPLRQQKQRDLQLRVESNWVSKRTLTVEKILNKFQKELEKDVVAYLNQAKRMCKYNTMRLPTRLVAYDELNPTIVVGTGTGQTNLLVNGGPGTDLISLGVKQHVDELFTSQPHLAPVDVDVLCERPYHLAGTIDHQLEQVSESLQTT